MATLRAKRKAEGGEFYKLAKKANAERCKEERHRLKQEGLSKTHAKQLMREKDQMQAQRDKAIRETKVARHNEN